MYFVKTDKETSEKESGLPISSMEAILSVSKKLTEQWKIFFLSFFLVLAILLSCFQDY